MDNDDIEDNVDTYFADDIGEVLKTLIFDTDKLKQIEMCLISI